AEAFLPGVTDSDTVHPPIIHARTATTPRSFPALDIEGSACPLAPEYRIPIPGSPPCEPELRARLLPIARVRPPARLTRQRAHRAREEGKCDASSQSSRRPVPWSPSRHQSRRTS